MKKVLYLSSWFPNRISPRNGNFIERQAAIMSGELDLSVLQVQYGGREHGFRIRLESSMERGYRVWLVYYYCYPKRAWKFMVRCCAWMLGLYCAYRSLGRPDLIHAHVILDAGCWAKIYGRLLKVPYVLSEHATLFQQNRLSFVQLWCCQQVIRGARFVLPVSVQLKNRLQELATGSFEVLGNPVDVDLFEMPEGQNTRDKLGFLHLSTLKQESKNIAGLIRVIAGLEEYKGSLFFTIAGDGPLEQWKNMAADLDLPPDFLHFRAELTQPEVVSCMQTHQVFVLFSFVENLPCVLLEAQACGMPIVATRVGGIAEIVPDNRYGILVEPGDEAGLREAILKVWTNFGLFDRRLIRQRAVQNYAVPAFRSKLKALYAAC